MSVENITNSKNRFIISGLASALSSLIVLLAISAIIKVAIIVLTCISTYLLLSLIHKIAVKKDKYSEAAQDEEYKSDNENEKQNTEISAEEKERMQAELEEESRNERAQEQMEEGLYYAINAFGAPITSKAQGVENGCSVDYTQAMVVPDTISLDSETQNTEGKHSLDYTQAAEVSRDKSYWAERMPSLPINMSGFDRSIPLNQPLSLLKIDTTTQSTYTGADIAATMRIPSTISFYGMDQQHQPYVQNYMNLMQSPPAHMSALDGSVPSSQAGISYLKA